MIKLAEKRDELEKLIEKQKGKLKPKGETEEMPERKPAAMPAQPAMQAQQTMQQLPSPVGQDFSGMQTSMMEQGMQPAGPQPQMPMQQPMMMQQPMPQQAPMPMIEEEAPEPEREEMATLQEPSLPVAQLAYNRTNIEDIEALVESVVEEKWRQAMESFGDINIWKERARTEIISIKQELLRLEQRFENIEKAMIGKLHEYDSNVLNIGAEIKAIEKVMQKIMQPLTSNIRELEKLTKKLKK